MKKAIELHEILKLCDEDSLLEWINENIDCSHIIEELTTRRIVAYSDTDEVLNAIAQDVGTDMIIDWCTKNIGTDYIKDYLKEDKYE